MRSADVFKAFQTLWDSDGTLSTLVPGGLNQGRIPEDASPPWAWIQIEEREWERTSGVVSIQSFGVQITVWSAAGVPDAGTIQQALERTFRHERKDDLEVRNARVLHLLPDPGMLDVDPARREAKDVQMARMAWHLMIQQNR